MKTPNNIPQIMKLLSKKYPRSTTTLNAMRSKKPNAFKILISCLLSLRARDENTEIVSKKLFIVADTPEKIVSLPIKKLEKIIFSSGHYKKKSQTLQHVSRVLIDEHKSKVPKTKDELLAIKGIGPKTANIVLAFAFGEFVIPVDTHVHRIPNRIGWIKTTTPEKSEPALEKVLPKKYWQEFNSVFVQFGRDICNPVSPKCSICPINKYCKKINVTKFR
jgi:endonuclease III